MFASFRDQAMQLAKHRTSRRAAAGCLCQSLQQLLLARSGSRAKHSDIVIRPVRSPHSSIDLLWCWHMSTRKLHTPRRGDDSRRRQRQCSQ